MLHHGFKKGTTLILIFKDNSSLICKFEDSKSNKIITNKGEFNWKDLRSTGIYKGDRVEEKFEMVN